MKNHFFLKELGFILFIKIILLFILWWTFFSHPNTPHKRNFDQVIFGQSENP